MKRNSSNNYHSNNMAACALFAIFLIGGIVFSVGVVAYDLIFK